MSVSDRLAELGLVLPAALAPPPGLRPPSAWVCVHGSRVLVSGHGPLLPDGSPAAPFGRVPDQVSPAEAEQSARLVALAIMASVQRAAGDLDRIAAWVSVSGFVQSAPGYANTTAVMNAFSDLVLDVFGADRGTHARTAIGVAALPLNLPVIVAAELALRE